MFVSSILFESPAKLTLREQSRENELGRAGGRTFFSSKKDIKQEGLILIRETKLS